jgi:hypothetical protein
MEKSIKKRYKGRYVPPSLSKGDREKQIESIIKKTVRPEVKSFKSKPSKWTEKAHKYFKGDTSLENISKTINVPIEALEKIIQKGERAYFESGSRPNMKPRQWGIARLYSLLFGTPSLRKMDGDIVEKYNIPVLKGGSILSPSLQDITRKKEEYGEDIDRIIALLSFNPENIFIAGSFGIRSMKYASDIDMIEPISFSSSISPIISKFKKKITEINNAKNVYLGDVKIGEVPEFEVIDETAYIENGKIYGYDATDAREKVNKLKSNGVITDEEYSQYLKLIKDKPTLEELQTIKKEIRPHILRWKATEIKKGEKIFRGETFKLKDAFTMGLVKVDIITFLNNGRITEASIIYDVRKKGIRINKFTINPTRSFKNDIQYYKSVGDYFKVLKRLFSLYSYQKDDKNIKKLYEILNSDLGIVNQIINDIDIVFSLLENHSSISKEKMFITISEFINRLNSIYTLNDYLKRERDIFKHIKEAINFKDREDIIKHLTPVKEQLKSILNKHSLKFLNKFNI